MLFLCLVRHFQSNSRRSFSTTVRFFAVFLVAYPYDFGFRPFSANQHLSSSGPRRSIPLPISFMRYHFCSSHFKSKSHLIQSNPIRCRSMRFHVRASQFRFDTILNPSGSALFQAISCYSVARLISTMQFHFAPAPINSTSKQCQSNPRHFFSVPKPFISIPVRFVSLPFRRAWTGSLPCPV